MYGWMASMMGAYRGSMPYAGMMSHYLGGSNSGRSMMGSGAGTGMMGGGYGYSTQSSSAEHGGWPTAAIVIVALLGGLLLVGAVGFARSRLPRRHRPPTTPAARQT
jgi:hypothetical protein